MKLTDSLDLDLSLESDEDDNLKDLTDSKLILNEFKLFPCSSRISLVPFRTFRGPLFPKPVTGQDLFFAVSYSKPALRGKLISGHWVPLKRRLWC